MTLAEFEETLKAERPPDLTPALEALWYDARGNWDRAHSIAQDLNTPDGAWVHAYLHRKEGDLWNARYWYERARRREAMDDLRAEWARIVRDLL